MLYYVATMVSFITKSINITANHNSNPTLTRISKTKSYRVLLLILNFIIYFAIVYSSTGKELFVRMLIMVLVDMIILEDFFVVSYTEKDVRLELVAAEKVTNFTTVMGIATAMALARKK